MTAIRNEPLGLICLCAQWCRTCEAYRETLQQLIACMSTNTLVAEPLWIDIEDQAHLVGDIEIETFPTVIIHRGLEVLFAGPVLPSSQALKLLISRLQQEPTKPHSAAAEYSELLARLRDNSAN